MTTTAPSIFCDPTKRHDFVFLFDVTNGNPNGDPDVGNLPRIDPETMHGLVTDVCIKRKIRDWVDMTRSGEERFEIYVQNKGIALNELNKRAHQAVFETKTAENGRSEQAVTEARRAKGAKDDEPKESAAPRQNARRKWMCDHFYDIRAFGAVLSTGDYPAGQVRGPIQLTFAQSISPITPLDISITRVAVTEIDEKKKTTTTMGRKSFVPYGLYLGHGFFVPHFAQQTGFSAEDLDLFWTALRSIWDVDRSASRGMLALRGLYVFSHENALGNAPAHSLFDRIHVNLNAGVQAPRHIGDYTVTIDEADLPEGVTLNCLA
jgi:CRISPR-associated protein Csd2